MPRLPYKPHDNAGPEEIVAPIRERRGGTLLELDRMLLYSPPFAKGWNGFLGAVRNEMTLSAKLRELAICAVAVLNGANYEFSQHKPVFIKAGGTEEQAAALADINQAISNETLFDNAERVVLALTREMTKNVQVSDETFSAAKAVLADDQQLVELIGAIATYNMVSRFLVALDVEAPEK